MAQVKETQITNIRFEVGLVDTDPSSAAFTLSAVTRDNSDRLVSDYREDIGDMITQEHMAVLAPLIQEGIQRIMTDRQITAQDLAEGAAAHQQRQQDAVDAMEQARADTTASPPDLPEVDPDALARQAAEDAQRQSDEINAEAERLASAGLDEAPSTVHTEQAKEAL